MLKRYKRTKKKEAYKRLPFCLVLLVPWVDMDLDQDIKLA
jgi:hypothetical protein